MSQLPPVPPASQSDTPAANPLDASLDLSMHAIWEKNRTFVIGTCLIVFAVIVLRGGWQYYSTQHELGVQSDFAAAGDQPGKLSAFAAANASDPLAGLAYLKVADEAYTAGDFAGAAAGYQKAAGSLTNDALLGRAKLGAAMSTLAGGDHEAGEAALKTVSADPALPKSVRAEATYHLAALAATAGRADEVRKLVQEVSQLDLAGGWSQRATLLLTNLPASAAAPVKASSDAITFKPAK